MAARTPVHRLLIVDDDSSVREWLGRLAEDLGYAVVTAASGEEALEVFGEARPHAVALDVRLPGLDGVATMKAIKALDPALPVIMLSGRGETRTIVAAIRGGAADFLHKPFTRGDFALALEKALERRAGCWPAARRGAARLVGTSRKMSVLQQVVDRVADTDITVLIQGESGTGKEVVARMLYERSSRSGRPFVKVNCAALPAALLESELFGYERGAFTGALQRKLGRFEVANGGTIFLDEITELPHDLQAKLLQVLQDGQFSRLGGESDVRVDARILAASNLDIEAAVREGTFRSDLYYRLNVVSIELPPLRQRRDEIEPLTEHFLRLYAGEYDKEYRPCSDALIEAFHTYRWPGNVRELENMVRRMVVLGDEQPVLRELAAREAREPEPAAEGSGELERFLAGEVDRVNLKRIARRAAQLAEKRLIERVLEQTRWNRKETAQILQISYKALLYKMRDAGLADSA